ncbi:ankyrin repeat ph and sec7 domain containing protein secg-related [Anaeramoeba flamelloides]|uniref:Ankyrin repeat ph and sec7 domain containing protein secg-related n=1 Tax=Anaeramoeba flamelloides TaxID=1746091 RepID=A0AAV7YH92_9EUKA|nr:ankyrin repeat ph and sec7 domain containing protein secg-related [Anaeramoeba flamelloides]
MSISEAITEGNVSLVRTLSENKKNLKPFGVRMIYPIHFAIKIGASLEIVSLLCTTTKQANICDKMTPLHYATKFKASLAVVRYLVQHGSKLNSEDGLTPLHNACRGGTQTNRGGTEGTKGTQKLKKANLEKKMTPLHYACKTNLNPSIIRLLMQNSPRYIVNLMASFEETKDKGSVETRLKYSKFRPIHFLCKNKKPNLESLKILLHNGANTKFKAINQKKVSLKTLIKDQETKNLIKLYETLFEDFKNLAKSNLFSDFFIHEIGFNKIFFSIRCGMEYSEKTNKLLGTFNKKKIVQFRDWLYTGNSQKVTPIKEIGNHLGLDESAIRKKSFKNGLIRDLKKIWKNQDSSDFIIILKNNGKMYLNKFILSARSQFFNKLFSENKELEDYEMDNNYPKSAITSFFHFIYFDRFPNDVKQSDLENIEKLALKYQLNEKTCFNIELELISSKK